MRATRSGTNSDLQGCFMVGNGRNRQHDYGKTPLYRRDDPVNIRIFKNKIFWSAFLTIYNFVVGRKLTFN